MTFFGFFAVVFMLISLTLLDRQAQGADIMKGELAKETCLSLSGEFDTAIAIGDGYYRTITVRKSLGEPYKIRVGSGSIGVQIGEGNAPAYYACAFSGDKAVGLASDNEGISLEAGKQFTIRNMDGVIEIEQ